MYVFKLLEILSNYCYENGRYSEVVLIEIYSKLKHERKCHYEEDFFINYLFKRENFIIRFPLLEKKDWIKKIKQKLTKIQYKFGEMNEKITNIEDVVNY